VKSNGVSVVPDIGEAEPVTWTFEMLTDADPEAVPPLPSVTTTVAGKDPVSVYIWETWAPVPVAPSPKDHA